MNEYHFSTEAAQRYGVNEAIFLHSLAFWVEKNRSNEKHFHDGRYWSYDTYKAIAKRFPFWTARQIERIVGSCKDQGAILVGNYNDDKTDRTQWYTLSDEVMAIYFTKTVECNTPNGEMAGAQGVEVTEESDSSKTPNGEMENTKRGDPSHQTVKCIKGNSYLPDSNTPISPEGEEGQKRSPFTKEVRDLLNAYVGQDRELAEALAELMQNRIKLKAINDLPSVKRMLNKLDKLSGRKRQAKLDLLDDAIQNSWKTVFPPSGGQRRGPYREEEAQRNVI